MDDARKTPEPAAQPADAPLPAMTGGTPLQAEVADLAARYRRANGPVMALLNSFGGTVEKQAALIPAPVRQRIEAVVSAALDGAYGLAGRGPDLGARFGDRGPMAAAVLSGAAGGAGGLGTAIAELPVTVTVILQAIRTEAAAAGFDPALDWVRGECLQIFGAGSPLAGDDGVNTSFLSARLTVTGPAVQRLIAVVAPRIVAALGPKLVAQAVPVIGAVTGAALNAAFLSYYREIARIRFALLRLAETHGTEATLAAFRAEAASLPLRRA